MTTNVKHGSTSTQNTQRTAADEITLAPTYPEEKPKSQPHVTVERQRMSVSGDGGDVTPAAGDDPFGSEEGAQIHYKTMEWWYVFLFPENAFDRQY